MLFRSATAAQPTEYFAPLAAAGMTLESINVGENDGQVGGSLGITFDSQSPSSSFEVGAILKPGKSIEDIMNSSPYDSDPDGGILEFKSYSWKTKTNGGDWKEVGNESTYTLTSDDFYSDKYMEGQLNLQLDFLI